MFDFFKDKLIYLEIILFVFNYEKLIHSLISYLYEQF